MIDAESWFGAPPPPLLGMLQWGRVVIDAESLASIDGMREDLALQWGRVVIDAESSAKGGCVMATCALQWGRVVIDAERPPSTRSRRG